MEQPQPNHGGDRPPVNSYGTDDPEVQARIEQARVEAARERRRDRAELERLVERVVDPDDAEAIIEFTHSVEEQRRQADQAATPPDPMQPNAERLRSRQHSPQIYIAPAHPHSGEHPGQWIDADQPIDELATAVTSVARTWPAADPGAWRVQATADFAGLDMSGFTDLPLIAQLARGVVEHGVAYAVWVEIIGTSDLDQLERFDDFYVGSYDSPEAWARAAGEDLEWDTHLDQVVDPMLRPYLKIDYARFARDQRQAWDVLTGIDGRTHVFMR